MWESLFSHPRGRLSTRNYFSIATAFLVVCFAYILAMAPTTHAADAKWNNDAIEYQQKNYRKESTVTVGNESHGIAAGAVIYKYVEVAGIGNGGSTQKAHLIYFPSGTDPATATSAKYQTFTLDSFGKYSQPSAVTNISLETSTSPGSTNPGTSSCVVEGIGWIICPVTNFLAGAMDTIYGWVSGFLKVAPLATSQDQALYRAWGYMRTLANVAFIIAFLVIIYSQITNVGLSNYDIKKMLPKIVIAAILVNTSYWICAIAVDLFNILGYSIQDLFIMIRNSLVGTEGNSWDVISWENMAGLVLSGGTVLGGAGIAGYLGITTVTASLAGAATIGAGVSALIFLLLPLLISILFIVLITLLILAARQAIITILIIIAPLAFVAFLLPNTEKWFEKWRSTLITLLLVFPAFSLVFGGSQLASAAIIQNASGPDALTVILLGMAVQVAPLAITPLLLKLGGGVLNRFAGIVNNPSKGIFDRGKNWARDRSAANKEAGLAALGERAKRMGYLNARPASSQSGFRGRMATAGMRFNPMNMTYAREYNRREREGMKSANEAMTGALHTQTTAGRRIDFRNKDAHAEKHLGESTNQEAYNIAAYGANGNAHTYRAQLHHDAHTASGRAKVIEDRATANAERDLQTQINTNAVLRNTKIQTDVDNAHAQFQAANVTAEGKAVFKREFEDGTIGGRALRLMNVQTSGFEKEAAAIDSMLSKRADADWERRSNTDPNVRRLRLKEAEASESFTRAEKEWQQTLSEIKQKGSSASTILASGNVEIRAMADSIRTDTDASVKLEKAIADIQASAQSRSETSYVKSVQGQRLSSDAQAAKDTLEAARSEEAAIIQERRSEKGAEGLSGEEKRIADELRDADIQKRAQTQRAAVASGETQQEYAGRVTQDEIIPGGTDPIAVVAGGIAGDAGISQAKATATQVIFKAFDEAVGAEKTLVSRNTPSDILGEFIPDPNDPTAPSSVIGLGSPDILDQPETRIAALAGKVAGGSHHESQIKLWQRMGELRRQAQQELVNAEASGDPTAIKNANDKIGKVKSLEQQAYGDKKKTPFGVGDVDQGQAQVGQYAGNIYESTRNRISTHMSAQTLAGMDPDDIRLIFEMARAGKLSEQEVAMVNNAYKDWEEDDNLKSAIQPKHRLLLDPIRQDATGNASYPSATGVWRNRYPVDAMSNPS